ncbi:MAG TPA: tetratricopeptide repeat protein [Gemmatimonadales bacterium]|nr:tetratricopeptide repeat protein [Gemmatimonadales bacterium]
MKHRPAEPADRNRRPGGGTRGLAITLGGLALVAALAAGIRAYWRRPIVFPAPRPEPVAPSVAFSDFVGSEACAECHTAEYNLWKASTHGNAGGMPTDAGRVIAPFDGHPMRFRDAAVTPGRHGNEYVFTVAQDRRAPQVFPVVAVVGRGFMAGGGTQAFFTRMPDGTVRFLPFDFSRAYNGWVCNTNGRKNVGLVPISPTVALADCGDWPPSRVLGSHERFEGCQQCHGSQILLQFDTTAKHYVTQFTTLAVNCESCHGPGRHHIELARSGHISESADIGMRSLSTLSKSKSLEVCFQCHAVKATLEGGYLPGAGLNRHFALKFPGLLDTIYFADGRTRAFAYQEGHLSSDCYLDGSMTCVDCHDPHSQHYRDINGAALPGRFDDGQCTDCHASKVDAGERHTHHRTGSEASRCTSCHMPYLQEPSVGPTVRYSRSDHTIPVPRPLYDSRLGIADGCIQCHRDRAPAALEQQMESWYGAIKPQAVPIVQAVHAESASDRVAAARLALTPAPHNRDSFARFMALSDFLERYITPNMPRLESDIVQGLEAFARGPDRDLKALSLATLHLARGSDPAVRRFLVKQLEQLDSLDTPVRQRWSWTLRARGNVFLGMDDEQAALASFERAQEIEPQDPAIARSLGIVYTRLRDYGQAAEWFARSLELDPKQPQVLVELAYAQEAQGSGEAAIGTYQRAIDINPWEPSAYANLGVAYLRRGSVAEAIPLLERALTLDPALANVAFALANAYQQMGRPEQAAAAVERGLEFDPGNAGARQMLDVLRGSHGGR